jgi:cyanate permease
MGRFGWRWAWFILAVLLCLMVIPISLVVMKKEPSDVGQDAYGSGTEDKRERIDPLPEDSSGSIPQAICSRNYLLTAATYFICGFQDYLFVTQLIPFVTDKGLTTQEASNLQGFAGLTSIVGLLFIAALSEKVGRKIPLFLTFLPRFVCFGLLLISSRRPFLYTSALLFGFAHMASAPLTAALIGDLYGLKNIGTLTGTIFWIHQTGGALGAYLGGIIYDLTNSYMVAFAGALFLAGVAALTSISISERGTKG